MRQPLVLNSLITEFHDVPNEQIKTMDTTYNFTLRFVRASDLKVEMPDRPLSRQTLQRIATRMSLVSEAIGFSILGILIIMHRHQANLNRFAGGIIGGISAILVGTVFLAAASMPKSPSSSSV